MSTGPARVAGVPPPAPCAETGRGRPRSASGAPLALSRSGTSQAVRYQQGRALRGVVPRAALGMWSAAADRPDVITRLRADHQGRVDELVPVRVGRMLASPYAYFRGAASGMADDLAGLPATGIQPVVCGDAHLGNIGFYASPERQLVLDLNDFDEAHPGCWEWDLRRLAASVQVAGRDSGAAEDECAVAVARCAEGYRTQLRRLAGEPLLGRSFERLDIDRLQDTAEDEALRDAVARAARQARKRTSDRALPKKTVGEGEQRRIAEDPPLVARLPDDEAERLVTGLDDYLATLPPHWARVLGGYSVRDIVRKVVGVGSVGLRAYLALCEGSQPDDVVFLQVKQARRSCLAKHVHGERAWHAHQGQRVVEYQQALQTVSDPLLGWTTVDDRQYFVRQWRDMKGAVQVEDVRPSALADYARICGSLLAKGHARTSGASRISGYVGRGEALDRALVRFAAAYADQVEADHAELQRAVERGLLPAVHGL